MGHTINFEGTKTIAESANHRSSKIEKDCIVPVKEKTANYRQWKWKVVS